MKLSVIRRMIWCLVASMCLQGLETAAYVHCMAKAPGAGIDHAHHSQLLPRTPDDQPSPLGHTSTAMVEPLLAAAPLSGLEGTGAPTDLSACTSCPLCCHAPGIVSDPPSYEQIQSSQAPPLTVQILHLSFVAEGPERPPRSPHSHR